ncbi:MAG: trypsin-like peptidase domain-containing protein [Eubacterium sp.]|nr:trypsin-like peptidase domain-containing protein [Eubacterium sp.]
MENNYNNKENHTENYPNEAGAAPNTQNTAENTGRQQENSSTYSYSYLNQEQKNPNNVWRADENTAGAYQTGNAYTNTNGQEGPNVYGSSQSSAGSAYGTTQTGAGNAYSASQAGASNTYGSAQTGADNAYQNAQYTAGNGTQPGGDNNYSNIYGNTDSQAGWNTYSDAKAQKKEERAKRRAAKKAENSAGGNFGIKLAKCASIALVFGLVAGTAFEGSSYLAGSLFGTNEKEATVSVDDGKEQETMQIEDSTSKTTPITAVPTASEEGVSAIVEECMPSIVAITNLSQKQLQNWFGQIQSYEVPSAGSGIIIDEDDDSLYIATNNHVIEGATTLTIRFCDDATAAAEIKGTDASTDLAVVQVKKADIQADTLQAIKVATLGDSDQIKVGSRAIAIGNALGYGQSVTGGYISALEREVTTQDEKTGKSYTNKLLQTDAAINPGNSGGALLNNRGEVIGINSSKYSDTDVEGIGFAIPINDAKLIFEDLITKKQVSGENAAYLGVQVEDVTAVISESYNMPLGVFVKEVYRGTAADQYGIKAGDIITRIDGRETQSSEALLRRLSYYEAGTQVEIVVERPSQNGYEEVVLSVVLGRQES